jgi:predicted metal-binding protein
MRKGATPKAAAPATVTGEVARGHWQMPGRRAIVGETLNPQAGRPASVVTERADGVFSANQQAWRRQGAGSGHPAPPQWARPMTVTLHVCTTCKAGEPVEDGRPVMGARLHAALAAAGAPEGVLIVPVECLSACNTGAAVALSAPGRWSYVYGRLTEADAADILTGAAAYAEAPDGIVPWRSRPVIFRKQSLARIPPLIPPLER